MSRSLLNRKSEMIVFSKSDQKIFIELPQAHSFVIFARGKRPFGFAPLDGAGTYEVGVGMLPNGSIWSLPIAIIVIPTKHVAAFEKMSPDAVSSMLASTEAASLTGARQ